MPKNTAQAKKFFYDWMDRNRPWNSPKNKENMYALMEEITNMAALFFHGEKTYSEEDAAKWESEALQLTGLLAEHPDGYAGPCACTECCEE